MPLQRFTNPNYQSVYEAGMARLGELERQKRAAATNAAAASGVRTSGVSQIPQGEISRAAILAESELGSDVAKMEEADRQAAQNFERQKELLNIQSDLTARAQDRWWNRQREQDRENRWSQLASGVIGAGGNVLAARYLRE